jgi:cystathionine beta-lyase family protein involved in aluminum resistance
MNVRVLIEFNAIALVKTGKVDPETVKSIITENVDLLELCESDDVFISPDENTFQVSIDEVTNATA